MPPAQRKATLHGVEVQQTQLQNKWYTPVDARVKIAEHADPALIRRADAGYTVVAVQFVSMGDRWAYHCLVEYPAGSGIITPGTDFIDLKDPSGVAKAETSAIGRALGLHGIAIEESIASADEMSRLTPDSATDESASAPTPQPRQQPARPIPAPTTQRTPAHAQRDAGSPTAAPAAKAGVSEWVTTDGYDPIGDVELKKRAHRIGVSNMADFEAILGEARSQYHIYDRAAIDAEMRVREGRFEKAQAKLANANQQQGA